MKLVMNKKEFSALIKEEVKKALREAMTPTEDKLVQMLKGGQTPVFQGPEIQAALKDPSLPPERRQALMNLAAAISKPGSDSKKAMNDYLALIGNDKDAVTVPGV